jgi:hypothetical protein
MSDNRIDSQGCSLKIDISTSTTSSYAAIGELADIPEIPEEYSERDRTTLVDTARQIHQGFPVVSKFDIEVAYNTTDAAQIQMQAVAASKELKGFQLVYSDSPPTTLYFNGKVMKKTAPYLKGVDSDAFIKFTVAKLSLLSTAESTLI